MFNFQWPWAFILLPLPFIVYYFLKPAVVQRSALKVPFYDQLPSTGRSYIGVGKSVHIALLSIIWLLLVSAAAKPSWLGEAYPLKNSSRDVMLAVDISGSMQTKDMMFEQKAFNRLQGIKIVLDGFIKRRKNDRLGLILFAENAYLQTPLTLDHKVLNQFLQEAQIGFAGESTAIGDAIGLAVKKMQKQSAKNKVLILLTDGANSAGTVTPTDAAKVAKESGLKVYTLGFGADELVVENFFSRQVVNPSADLDEKTLTDIASVTGGKYFRARNIDELVEIYQLLDQLEPVEIDGPLVKPRKALFYWPLFVALALSFIWSIFRLIRSLRREKALSNDKKVN